MGVVLVLGALLVLHRYETGVDATEHRVEGTPVTVYRPDDGEDHPVVLVCHGFAGSQQLMQSFSLSLARSGYVAVAFDYLGHGRNPHPLTVDITQIAGATQKLVEQTRSVADFALALQQSNGELALLGHSMASDIIVRYAAVDPRVQATVAVSMFSTAVTADSPKNLLVLVGGLEGFLRDEALRVLGLVTDDPRPGVTVNHGTGDSAWRVAIIDGVEHVGILFAAASQREALAWLNRVFGGATSNPAADRGPAIVALLLGLALLAYPLARALPRVVSTPVGAGLSWRRLLPAGLVPALVTPLVLVAMPADFMGALVGGYLAVHFLVYGLITAAVLWRVAPGFTRVEVRWGSLALATLLATAFLAGAFGWALDTHVTSYAITPARLPLLLVTLLGTLSYFLTDEWLAHGEGAARGGHWFTRTCFLLSLGIAVALSFEALFFLLIIAAVIVIYFLVYGLLSRWLYQATGHPLVPAIANAVTFAWALAAVFPFIQA